MAPAMTSASRARRIVTASRAPSTTAWRTASTVRRSALSVARASGPCPIRGSSRTPPIVTPDIAAGSAVRSGDRCPPARPAAMIAPITATATKLTELLMRKNATERRATLSAGMPEDPRAEREAARAAGRHERPDGQLRPADVPARPPRRRLAEHGPEHEHVRDARQRLEHHRDRDPFRVGGAKAVADRAEAGREGGDQADDDEQRDDPEPAPHEAPRRELGGERETAVGVLGHPISVPFAIPRPERAALRANPRGQADFGTSPGSASRRP